MRQVALYVLIGSIMTLFLTACVSSVRFSSEKDNTNVISSHSITNRQSMTNIDDDWKQTGIASYYSDKFEGKATASGETYRKDDFTAAHRELPFGTKVNVLNLRNKRQVIVTINDRGPFVGGRIIDLSRAAAEALEMLDSGLESVEITIIK